ncbi:unnamed protein product, partial [Amoebophrya sp. A120]
QLGGESQEAAAGYDISAVGAVLRGLFRQERGLRRVAGSAKRGRIEEAVGRRRRPRGAAADRCT